MIQRLAVDSILGRQADLSKTQLQLATGRRILTPSEDPSGATQVLALKQQISQNEKFQTNIDRLKSRLELEETVLSGVGNSLQRVRELAVKGLSDSNGPQDRAAIAAEVKQRLDEVFQLANSQDGTGEYLFSGYQSKTTSFTDNGNGTFTYNGDYGQRKLQISPTREVESSDSGGAIFEDLSIVAGGKQNIFETLTNFANDLVAGTQTGDILTDLDTAMDKIFTTRAEIGGRLNSAEAQASINEQFDVQLNSVLSGVQDLDYAEAIGRLNLELTGLEAAQSSFQKIQGLSLFSQM